MRDVYNIQIDKATYYALQKLMLEKYPKLRPEEIIKNLIDKEVKTAKEIKK
jgi:hypothetical protein